MRRPWILSVLGTSLLASSAAVLIGAPAGPGDVGARPPGPRVLTEDPTARPAAPAPDAPRQDRDAVTAAPAEPERLLSHDLGLSAPVDPVGVDDDSQVEVPSDITRVGWYRFGPGAGATSGSAVLVGHVDSAEQGRGALWPLGGADVDDVVEVELSDGTAHAYRIVARELIDKEELPTEEIFARRGPHRLTLVTCGGEFDPENTSYSHNIVVTAVPLESR
ncbi:class F sortase [Nocardiopsis sp. RV163]|uniref:class F sortase n=1 Tax=Nocardiopsis sp. RV163 TaxID=1661388 RepID=UPI00069CC3D3|nr:class F sortase [Nocardiopsis sp. RV163]